MPVGEEVLALSGPVKAVEFRTDDRVSTQRVCSSCHTRIYNTNTRRPGIAVVRAGTLDWSEELECAAHIFINYRQRWFALPEGVPAWPEAPEPAEFIAALQPRSIPNAPPRSSPAA